MSANASLESALAQTIDELNASSIPYMLIGGLADSLAEALGQPELGAFLREHRPPQ